MDFEQPSAWTQMPTEEELLMMQMGQSQGTDPAMAMQALPPAPAAMGAGVGASMPDQPKKGAAPAPHPALAQLQAMQKTALDEQKKGIGIYEKSIGDLLNKSGGAVDFTPLAALVDSWMPGSKLSGAAAAQKPMTDEQRKVLATKLQDELQRRKGDYSKAQLDAAKSQLMFALGMEKAGKGTTLPISEVEKIADASASQSALSDIKKLVEKNSDLFGPDVGLLSRGQAWAGVGEKGRKASAIQAQLKQLAQIIGKGLEGGKLTDQDILRYEGMLPQFGDAPAVVADKITSLQRLIQQKHQAQLETATQAGYSTKGLPMPSGDFKKPGVDTIAGTGGQMPGGPETKTYQGKTYQLTPGADRNKQESWVVVQ